MAESNTTPKFLIVADGDISVIPMQRVVPERQDIRWSCEAIKNSVFESFSLSLIFTILFRISANTARQLEVDTCSSPGNVGQRVITLVYHLRRCGT